MSSMKKSNSRASLCSIPSSCRAPSSGLISGFGGGGLGISDLRIRPSSERTLGGSVPLNRSAKNARNANKIRFNVGETPKLLEYQRHRDVLAGKGTFQQSRQLRRGARIDVAA